jgi:poly-beta-1,6-N-acetyl-D-glucosamine synthase
MSDRNLPALVRQPGPAPGEVRRLPVPITRTPLAPAGTPAPDPRERLSERHFLRRIGWLSGLAAVLLAVIVVAMEDPLGWGVGITLSWQGLFVYASIIALALFLTLLLLRYFGVLYLSYINQAKYTAQEEAYTAESDAEAFLPPVSVIIPAYNEDKLIERTITSLLALDYPFFEIVVVDDGSSDTTHRLAEAFVGRFSTVAGGTAEVKLVAKPNGGKATALNAGIAAARFDVVLCVDGDSELAPSTLRRAVRHLRDPRVGAVAGNVKVKNRKGLWTRLQALEYVEGLNMVRAAQSAARLVNIIPGPVGLFRREALQSAGFYSPDTYAEDCDVTLKVLRAGWRVVYEPEAIAWTEAPDSLLDLLKQRYRWTRGILQAVRKHKRLFFNPFADDRPNVGGTMVMWAMAFESLIWPAMNIFAHLFFVSAALLGYSYYLILWWLSLTLLDFAAAVYCVATEKEDPRLIPYVLVYRTFFILTIDVCKVFATIEEMLGLGMNWGKLDRIGEPAAA